PQVDIWLGAGVENLVQAKKEGLLQSHISEPVSVIPVKWRDQDGYWLGIYLDVPVFVTNKDLFTRQQTDLPHTWEDLLKPQYKYKIALADPGVSNATLAMFAAIQQQLG
ncbi:MAG TPA: iron ABC transporter substrate-binding protein, partial [Firmicutes bacterium]|nr:iron ABC transporter substrate-binding protein [Bacillota bacterium]